MFFVLLMILPSLYIEPPLHSILMSAVVCIVFCCITGRVKGGYPSIVEMDHLNAVCSAAISFGFIAYTRNLSLTNIQAAMQFRAQSEMDPLTGIANKASAERQCKLYLERCGVSSCAMLLIDLDDFKRINDTLGHQQGDGFLRQVGEILRHTFRESDIVGRVGGDEFLVLMKNCADEGMIAKKAGEINTRIGEIFQELTTERFTCSVGISTNAGCHFPSYQALFFQADRALYHVKQNHKNRYEFYSEQYAVSADKPLLLIVDDAEVSRAILRSCFEEDYAILEAENGQEAITYIERYTDMLAAVLLDIEMPVMNGYEVLKVVRSDQALRVIPILVITAHEKMELQALELGAADLIVKPFDPLVVKKRVANAREHYKHKTDTVSEVTAI